MGSKLSCCFHVKKTRPAAEQELEALRDIQMKVDCIVASNFSQNSCLMLYVTSEHLSSNVLFVKNISSNRYQCASHHLQW